MEHVQYNLWSIKDLNGGPSRKKSDSDFYTVLKAATYLGHITGTFFMSLKGRIGTRKYATSYVAMIYGVLIFCLLIGGSIYFSLRNVYSPRKHTGYRWILRTTEDIVEIVKTAAIVAIFASLVLGREKLANVLNDIKNQDKILGQFGIRLDYASESKRSYIRMGIFLLLVFISVIVRDYSEPAIVFNLLKTRWITVFATVWIVSCTYIFVDAIYLLKERFRLLNEHLVKITQKAKESRLEASFSSCRISTKIRSIAATHKMLTRSAMELNQIFGVTIAVAVLYHTISLTVCFYFVYGNIIHRPSVKYLDYVLHMFATGTMNCIQIIILVATCTLAKNQASSTGQLIHDLKFSEFDTVLNDSIQLFSLQLQHEKVDFSGLGLFTLDATLVQSIAATVTTYLIILIQSDAAVKNAATTHQGAANNTSLA